MTIRAVMNEIILMIYIGNSDNASGLMAQWLAHQTSDLMVAGSSPADIVFIHSHKYTGSMPLHYKSDLVRI